MDSFLDYIIHVIPEIKERFDGYASFRTSVVSDSNLDHIVNTFLNGLNGFAELITDGLLPVSEFDGVIKDVNEIVNSCCAYFFLLDNYPLFKEKEINGLGFLPTCNAKDYVINAVNVLFRKSSI